MKRKQTEIKNLHNSVVRDKLMYKYKGNTSDADFSENYGAIDLINKIKVGDVFVEYTERVSEAKFRSKQKGTGLKILTPNQMLKRLPIALAQTKAGNNSESLLNEIRQIVYYLYRSKEITKKVYNNIIKSIKV